MKLLLSCDTIKMHELEAKAQGVPLDDIIKRETLFTEDQKTVKYRNEKIDGEQSDARGQRFVRRVGNSSVRKRGW